MTMRRWRVDDKNLVIETQKEGADGMPGKRERQATPNIGFLCGCTGSDGYSAS
jgi:hypothetical protein